MNEQLPPIAPPPPEPPEEPKRGRPTHFTRPIAYAICLRLAAGETLREICRDENMPPESTVRLWALDNAGKTDGDGTDGSQYDGFSAQYARAREIGYLGMADEVFEIADDGRNDWVERENKKGDTYIALNHEHVQRSKLRVDSRIWALSKALPKIYGNKLDLNVSGTNQKRVIDPATLTEEQAQELYEQAIS